MRHETPLRAYGAVALAVLGLLIPAYVPTAFGRAGGLSREYWSETRIPNLPPDIRAAIQKVTASCERPLAARSTFDRYLQDRSGDRFVALHFQDLRCGHQAVCNASGCLAQVYESNGGHYRLVWSGYVADIELEQIGTVAGLNITCSGVQPGCSGPLRWNGLRFTRPAKKH
jgi:hypothetical protein